MELNLTVNETMQKTIRFDKNIFRAIEQAAKQEGRSFNVEVNRLLLAALFEEKQASTEQRLQDMRARDPA